jgi:hypothetical protein
MGTLGGGRRQLQTALAVFMMACCSLAAVAFAAGRPLWCAALLVIGLGPAALYLAVRMPLVFPFGLYLLILPFDTLTSMGSFGSLTKAIGLVSAAALAARLFSRRDALLPSREVLAWLALLLWIMLSTVWAINTTDATAAMTRYLSLIALYALLSIVPIRRGELRLMLGIALSSGLLAGLYILWLLHTGQVWAGTASQRVVIQSGDAWVDPNDLGSSLLLATALALWATMTARAPFLRMLGGAALLVLALAIVATASRSAIIGLLGLFFYLILRSRHRVPIAVGLAVCAVAGLALNPAIIERFQAAGTTDAAGRTDIWAIGLHYVPKHWMLGAGIGNFPDAFQHEYLHVFVHYPFDQWNRPAHSVFVQLIVELGVLGLALFIVALTLQWRSLRCISKFHPDYELRVALEGAFVALVLASFSLDMIDAKYFWLLLAMMSLLRTAAMRSEAESSDEPPTLAAARTIPRFEPALYGRKS